MIGLVMVVDSTDVNSELFEITADDQIYANVKAIDQKGNRWSVTANWSIDHSTWDDQNVLSQTTAEETIFRPILSSNDEYRLSAHTTDLMLTSMFCRPWNHGGYPTKAVASRCNSNRTSIQHDR